MQNQYIKAIPAALPMPDWLRYSLTGKVKRLSFLHVLLDITFRKYVFLEVSYKKILVFYSYL